MPLAPYNTVSDTTVEQPFKRSPETGDQKFQRFYERIVISHDVVCCGDPHENARTLLRKEKLRDLELRPQGLKDSIAYLRGNTLSKLPEKVRAPFDGLARG